MSPLIPASNRLVGSRVLTQSANEVGSEFGFTPPGIATFGEAVVLTDEMALGSIGNCATSGGVKSAAKSPAAISKPINKTTARKLSLPTDLAPEPLIAASR